MPNSITTITKYTERLDAILQQGPLTNDLNINADLVGDLTGAGEIKIAKLSMDGLADHKRGGGFVAGDLTLNWETVKLAYDRGRKFNIDAMDDEESEAVVTAEAMGEFARTKVVPEVDAVRFAKLAAAATTEGTISTNSEDVSKAYDIVLQAEEFVQDYGSALQDCVFYCSPAMKTLLRKGAQDNFQLRPGEGPNTNFMTFDEMKLVTVPATRFYTAINLYDGTSDGETSGGYAKDETDGRDINFMVVNPACAEAIVKHNPLRYFAPDVNQADDAHLWEYRLYHDLFVYENKRQGIFLSTK